MKNCAKAIAGLAHWTIVFLLLLSFPRNVWPFLGTQTPYLYSQQRRALTSAVAGISSHRKTFKILNKKWQLKLKDESSAKDDFKTSNKLDHHDEISINTLYVGLATAETIFWWYLAPGIDPESRWFAPSDGILLSKLFDPSIVLSPGAGYSFSSLLLNSFLILPTVWSILLLQEDTSTSEGRRNQFISPWPFCLASFFVGGGSLMPYMIFRNRGNNVAICYEDLPRILKFFENSERGDDNQRIVIRGPIILVGLAAVVLSAFFIPLLYHSDSALPITEYQLFVERIQHSQFTSLALFDFIMISLFILDPMVDDAKRRGYLPMDLPWVEAGKEMLPFLFPLIGPVSWIYFRPGLPR